MQFQPANLAQNIEPCFHVFSPAGLMKTTDKRIFYWHEMALGVNSEVFYQLRFTYGKFSSRPFRFSWGYVGFCGCETGFGPNKITMV